MALGSKLKTEKVCGSFSLILGNGVSNELLTKLTYFVPFQKTQVLANFDEHKFEVNFHLPASLERPGSTIAKVASAASDFVAT